MVKGVATSIITVAVLMGSVVACGGTTQVVAPTPEPEPTVDEAPEEAVEENCISDGDKRIEDLFYISVNMVNGFAQHLVKAYSGDATPEEGMAFIEEGYSALVQAGKRFESNGVVASFCDPGTYVLYLGQLQSARAWHAAVTDMRDTGPEFFIAREVNFADSSCALSKKLNFTVPAYLQSISDLC